jgi:lysophospholipase L1-like esterase
MKLNLRLLCSCPDIALRSAEGRFASSFEKLTLMVPGMSASFRSVAAAAGLVLAVCANSSGWAQEPTPVRPQTAPAIEAAPAEPQTAVEPATGVAIIWAVTNRFRLFRDVRDFRSHAEATRGRTVLEAEQALAAATDGGGWARNMIGRLCLDRIGEIADQCVRDGARENYLNPSDHRVEVQLTGLVPTGATCTWSFVPEGAAAPAAISAECSAPVTTRVPYGKPTMVTVDLAAPGEAVRRAAATIAVRDLLIAGLGDSIASGDGNPDRPVALSDEGFCFRRFALAANAEFFRPGRAGFSGDKACDGDQIASNDRPEWARLSARWMSPACHRSLYGYQLRAALALAVESPHLAVTFLPLGCTGATINDGIFNGQRARELNCDAAGTPCPTVTPAQITQLRALLTRAQRGQPARALDLVFLTIGANDINFSGLIADIIIEGRSERAVFSRAGIISSVEAAQASLDRTLPGDFARLRAALKPLVNNALERVVFVSYGNPALTSGGGPCPGGHDGFDIHPAFGVDGERLRRAASFVQNRFLPTLKDIVTCSGRGACPSPSDAMTFVDSHQAVFAEHGFCVRAETDPPFDRECFSPDGKSFNDSLVNSPTDPLVCNAAASAYQAYAPRARWIRTPNDAYFAAMTFPEGVSATIRPSNLHDATWGVLAAVYGGAIHPTAEGHAAMADAALAGARSVLQLTGSSDPIIAAPLPPLPAEAK